MTVIWCMVPQIWSVPDKLFCHFGPFFALLPPNNSKNQNLKKCKSHLEIYHFTDECHQWKSYDVWFLRYGACGRQNVLSFWTVFCPFTPLTTRKIKVLKKQKEKPGDIIILHMCTINIDQMRYGSRDIKRNRCLLFWTIFCPFPPLTTQKIKFWKTEKRKEKKHTHTWRYHHFTQVYQKSWSYAILFLRYCF